MPTKSKPAVTITFTPAKDTPPEQVQAWELFWKKMLAGAFTQPTAEEGEAPCQP